MTRNQSGLHVVDGEYEDQHEAPTQEGWVDWLRRHTDPDWRPGEWNHQTMLFTGDLDSNKTTAWACRTPGCLTPTAHQHRRCDTCRRARTMAGIDWAEFDAAPPPRRTRPLQVQTCMVPGCASELYTHKMCARHHGIWRRTRMATAESVETFIAAADPLQRRADCVVDGCERERVTGRGLCRLHDNRLHRAHRRVRLPSDDFADWVAAEQPRLALHQFCLAGLPGPVATEVLYALQRRDQTPAPLDPSAVRFLCSRLRGADSLRRVDPAVVCESGGMVSNAAAKSVFVDLRRHLERAWTHYRGIDPFASDVWQVALLDLRSNASRPWPATQGVIDFAIIEAEWLRVIVKDWAKATRPYLQRLRETLRAVRAASQTLAAAGRLDPTSLGAGDFTRITDAICNQRRDDGDLYSANHRNLLLHQFATVIEHGRAAGLMSTIPDTFRPLRRIRVRRTEPNEDGYGKALPESVIAQLDANLGLLGPAGRAGSLPAADLQRMYHTIYQILRDTGRRPGEVVSLHTDCLEVVDGRHNLIYDNHKAGRMRRRLPITTATAELITNWRAHREQLPTAAATAKWLFPSPQLRTATSRVHLTPACVARAVRAWAAVIGVLDSELLGPDGTPAPFDSALVAPYALRHSYAQRHADAGVAVDVLRDLMDHVSVTTTMGYYRIGAERKRQAIAAVGALATDTAGKPAPFTDTTAYQRASVSVPFGNCTEPSNVTAGGGACPIRFQCAGCGFYRPDPSYLPAIEEHIASLRVDRETAYAIGAAEYVTSNLTAQIDAFTGVAEAMRTRLAELGDDERAEVEAASNVLRKARAARQLPIIAVTSSGSEPA